MAIIDVRILRSLKLSESKSDKDTIQLSATQELLFIADTKDPSFSSILENDDTWPNLGNEKAPQIDDEKTVKGVTLYVTSRELSYYKDNERAVVMTVKYDAKAPSDEGEEPQGTDAETWQKITVTSQQMTMPAIGWPTRGAVPAEGFDAEGRGAQNSAGDPIDGLEEDRAMVKMTYTNTQVANPIFDRLQYFTNRCNEGDFLGGADYTVRVVGWNAEYDQKNNTWSVSVEFLYNPEGWQIEFFDVGYNEILLIDDVSQRRAILDVRGNPVSKPVPLNGGGRAQEINANASAENTPALAQTREMYPYKIANLSSLFALCGI
jgi:hypothetical protein